MVNNIHVKLEEMLLLEALLIKNLLLWCGVLDIQIG